MTAALQRRVTTWTMMGLVLLALGKSLLVSDVKGMHFLTTGMFAVAVVLGDGGGSGAGVAGGDGSAGPRPVKGILFVAFVLSACVSVIQTLFPR